MDLIITMVFIISVSDLTAAETPTLCKRPSFAEMELNYSLPIRPPCGEKTLSNGSTITTIPKLIPWRIKNKCQQRDGIPGGHRICRRPDCLSGPCQRGWCEETMVGYHCHCPEGFSGKDCSEAPVHASNMTDDAGSNTTTSSSLSHSSKVTQQSVTMWSLLYSSFTSWMTTEATMTSTETDTVSTEMSVIPTKATSMSTDATTMSTEAATMSTEASTMSTEATTMSTEVTMMSTEVITVSTEAATMLTESSTMSTEATTISTSAIPECPVIHTLDTSSTRKYTFPNFTISPNLTYFDFFTRAKNDVHVGLFTEETGVKYEIAIGGWQNTGGHIVRSTSSHPFDVLHPLDFNFSLSGIQEYDHFEVYYYQGHIKVCRYGRESPLMEAVDSDPLIAGSIQRIGIFTGFGSEGYWIFPTLFC